MIVTGGILECCNDFRGKNQAAKDVAGRHPISHSWDWEEPKLLVCEAKYTPPREPEKSPPEKQYNKWLPLNKASSVDEIVR